MEQNDHFSVTWLKERVLYVIVQNVDFVTTDWSETETWQQQQQHCYIWQFLYICLYGFVNNGSRRSLHHHRLPQCWPGFFQAPPRAPLVVNNDNIAVRWQIQSHRKAQVPQLWQRYCATHGRSVEKVILKGYVLCQYLWIVRWRNGYTTTMSLEVFTQRNFVADFIRFKEQKIAFWAILLRTELTHALHLQIIGKPVVNFLFVIIELFSLSLTTEML